MPSHEIGRDFSGPTPSTASPLLTSVITLELVRPTPGLDLLAGDDAPAIKAQLARAAAGEPPDGITSVEIAGADRYLCELIPPA